MGKYDALINDLDRFRDLVKDERENNGSTLTDEFYVGMLSGVTAALYCIKAREQLEGGETNVR